jgi:hypothetical protein
MIKEYRYPLDKFRGIEFLSYASSIDVKAESREDISVIFEEDKWRKKARYTAGIVGENLSVVGENVSIEAFYPDNLTVDKFEILSSASSIDIDGPINVTDRFLFKATKSSVNIYGLRIKGGTIDVINKTSSVDIELILAKDIKTIDLSFDKSSVDIDLILPENVSLDVDSDTKLSSIDIRGKYTVANPISTIKMRLVGIMSSLDINIKRI